MKITKQSISDFVSGRAFFEPRKDIPTHEELEKSYVRLDRMTVSFLDKVTLYLSDVITRYGEKLSNGTIYLNINEDLELMICRKEVLCNRIGLSQTTISQQMKIVDTVNEFLKSVDSPKKEKEYLDFNFD